jgi:transposase
VKKKRQTWFEKFRDVMVKDLVFIDEFGSNTTMSRAYARGPSNARVVCKIPNGHWKTLSTIAALTTEGILGYATFEGSTDQDMFVEFIREGLLPGLKPGQHVVLDNLSVHKSALVQELIESAGAKLMLLPQYSPDFNPIEMAISKIKSYLRKKAKRNVDDLTIAIDEAMRMISKGEAVNYIRHCGYATDVL